jgi:hypothetical protein
MAPEDYTAELVKWVPTESGSQSWLAGNGQFDEVAETSLYL